ncbi:alpha/beta fold hydrolase [Tsukamurella sp. 1534]|uniref:alpha/beta fold hydrolase n=1 Tax=Tsukamurella sp. 1534 TaxID=1151061 RepID=UPI0002DBE5EC|nr:alpha/beta fold hydrolase [Tsukamurella sp. 1534]
MIRPSRLLSRRPRLGRDEALGGAERLAAVCHAVASAEYLTREIDRGPGGLADWSIERDEFLARSPRLGAVVDPVSGPAATRAAHIARLAAASALLAPTPAPVRAAAGASLAVTSAVLQPRNHFGADGADHVSFMVSAVCALARAGRANPRLVDACLWYLASQATLSYTASGWVKLTSPAWRSGRAVREVTRTRTYGDPLAWKVFDSFPRVTAALERGVLACECLFPVSLLFGGRPAPFFAAAMGTFHLANTRVMGLGRFFWAFTSMYPPLLYATDRRRRAGGADAAGAPRSDAFPRTVALGAAAAAVALNGARLRRRRRVRAGRGDERVLRTAAGALRYRVAGEPPGAAATATVILVNGLGAIPEAWEHLALDLAADHRVITYDRAEDPPLGGSLDAEVTRLADLVRAEGAGAPVHLVGHSLGGYLALRAAESAGPAVGAVTLLDASHPGQLRRSEVQATGTAQLGAALRIIAWSMRLGLGELAQRPRTVDRLPEHVRGPAVDRFRDPRLWAAADREWRELLRDFEAKAGDPPATAVPRLVVTAELSEAHDPVHARLQDEYAAAGALARREVIAGADHDDLLYREEHALRIAALVRAFETEARVAGIPERKEGSRASA